MPTTLGLHSPLLERARALKTPAGRREQDRFAIEGPTMLAEALDAGLAVEAVFTTEAAFERLGEAAGRLPKETYIVPDRAAAKLSDLDSPPGIIAVVRRGLNDLATLLASGRPLALLAGINDPGNAGTLLRTAEFFGFGGAIFGSAGAEPHNPKVVRASMGAIFRLPIAAASPASLRQAAEAGSYTVVAAAGDGRPLDGFRFPERTILAVGNERRGLDGWVLQGDPRVAIPQKGRGESLNAAAAGSIIMYVLMQQSDRASDAARR